jgi:hypothetical protein
MDEIGLLLVSILFPFKPSVSKTDSAAVLPQRLKHFAGRSRFNAGINEWRFIPPLGSVTPDHGIKMQLLISFAQQQNCGAWRHVESTDRFRVIWDITVSFVSEKGEIVFMRH